VTFLAKDEAIMNLQRRRKSRASRGQQGFTLVEMAVVLVVIGLIIAAVVVGQDVQRNAEYLKIRETFVSQWAEAYHTYLLRIGVPVGDNPMQPTLMVGGADYGGNADGTISGENMSNVSPPPAVCSGQSTVGLNRGISSDQDLRTLMLQAGVKLPQGRGQGHEDQYAYTDSNGNPQVLRVCFQWNNPTTPSGSGNVMVITGLTPDLARFLAASINGQAGANEQLFRDQSTTTGASSNIAAAWTGNNTNVYGENVASGNGNLDHDATREAQVYTVSANYQMTQ
jgi:prepilin-type N-terminal cleavage/methylation domain-containing protein